MRSISGNLEFCLHFSLSLILFCWCRLILWVLYSYPVHVDRNTHQTYTDDQTYPHLRLGPLGIQTDTAMKTLTMMSWFVTCVLVMCVGTGTYWCAFRRGSWTSRTGGHCLKESSQTGVRFIICSGLCLAVLNSCILILLFVSNFSLCLSDLCNHGEYSTDWLQLYILLQVFP